MRVVIFANGRLSNPTAYRHLVWADDLILAADGGAAHALAAGLTPHVVIGDLDSLEPALQAQMEAAGARFLSYPSAKEETDLELALLYAAEQGVREILVLGALGGRLDQTLANILLLAHPALEQVQVQVVEGDQTAFLIRHQALVQGNPGDTVSLLPLGGDAQGVTAEGLRWPLRDETLRFGPARGVSNVLLGRQAWVQLREGCLLCVVTHHPSYPSEQEEEK